MCLISIAVSSRIVANYKLTPAAMSTNLELQPVSVTQEAPAAEGQSVFDVTQRDADKYVATPNQQFEDDDDNVAYPLRGREYWTCIKILCWTSIFLCLWPFSCTCLYYARSASTKTAVRNNEKDYLSAQSCSHWSLCCIIVAIVFMILTPVILIITLASVLGTIF